MSRKIAGPIRENARLFLKRAIQELVSDPSSNEKALTEEQAIMAVSLIQSCFELSVVALFIERSGLAGIVNKGDTGCTEEELLKKFEDNDLSTKNFNVLKEQLVQSYGLMDKDNDIALIDDFQRMRNKVMHLKFHFDEGDRFDLQFELIYFITRVIIPILDEEEINPAQVLKELMGSDGFRKLVAYPAYRLQAHRIALCWTPVVHDCMKCGCNSLGVDYDDSKCYACCASYHGTKFIDCQACKAEQSVIYDNLNITSQPQRIINGRCLRCQISALVHACQVCDRHDWYDDVDQQDTCTPSRCAVFTED
jgi:hypothetical protein